VEADAGLGEVGGIVRQMDTARLVGERVTDMTGQHQRTLLVIDNLPSRLARNHRMLSEMSDTIASLVAMDTSVRHHHCAEECGQGGHEQRHDHTFIVRMATTSHS